jgi:hypothetical protein
MRQAYKASNGAAEAPFELPLAAGGFFLESNHGGGLKLQAGKLRPNFEQHDDHEVYCWQLLDFTMKESQVTAHSKELLDSLGATITAIDNEADAEGDYTEWFLRHGDSGYAFVRPDAFVYGFAKDAQALEGMLIKLFNDLEVRVNA